MGWLERSELEPELERILFLHLGVAMLYLMWEVFCLLFAREALRRFKVCRIILVS